jgi:hypothetical protein
MSLKIEFGDWQTPNLFAIEVANRISHAGVAPSFIIEPTCGTGAFVYASASVFKSAQKIIGFEVNKDYLDSAISSDGSSDDRIEFVHKNFYEVDWLEIFAKTEGKPLVVGNLPWVTSSTQGVLGSTNLPTKTNTSGLSGHEARTGKSNFDISEWMSITLLRAITNRDSDFAMLLKTSVARKVISFLERESVGLSNCELIHIDAGEHFDASVDACLLIVQIDPTNDSTTYDYKVFADLQAKDFKIQGQRKGMPVSNIECFESLEHLGSGAPQKWRSGVKHDLSKVMEISEIDGTLFNGYGQVVEIESKYLFPLFKGSDIGNNRKWRKKFVILTQMFPGEQTAPLKENAPKLWAYLESYKDYFSARKSSIYKNNPNFSLFGIGPYTFKPYKIAICGLYKRLRFVLVEPCAGKPPVFDDTVYFVGFDSLEEATCVLNSLNSATASEYLESLTFWDEKRPIKTSFLNTLNWSKIEGNESLTAG